MHIAIAGNIGSGKTTLTTLLAKRYGWTPRFEPVDNNPYLSDFYADMARWSFNTQIYFLNKRFKEVVEISRSPETVIQDRTIFEDARIFAPNLHAQGLMSDRDFENYTDYHLQPTGYTSDYEYLPFDPYGTDLYDKPQYQGKSLWFLIPFAVGSPAPEFFVSEKWARLIYMEEMRGWRYKPVFKKKKLRVESLELRD